MPANMSRAGSRTEESFASSIFHKTMECELFPGRLHFSRDTRWVALKSSSCVRKEEKYKYHCFDIFNRLFSYTKTSKDLIPFPPFEAILQHACGYWIYFVCVILYVMLNYHYICFICHTVIYYMIKYSDCYFGYYHSTLLILELIQEFDYNCD